MSTSRAECWISLRWPTQQQYDMDDTTGNPGVDPSAVPASPETGQEDQLGETTGFEEAPVGGMGMADTSAVIDVTTREMKAKLDSGAISLAQAMQAGDFHFCGVSFRRKITRQGGFRPWRYNWGGRTSCNRLERLSGQAFLKYARGDRTLGSGPGYGPLFSRNVFDGKKTSMRRRRVARIEYYTNVTVPAGGNFVAGVAADPESADLDDPWCRVDGNNTARCLVISKTFD